MASINLHFELFLQNTLVLLNPIHYKSQNSVTMFVTLSGVCNTRPLDLWFWCLCSKSCLRSQVKDLSNDLFLLAMTVAWVSVRKVCQVENVISTVELLFHIFLKEENVQVRILFKLYLVSLTCS